MRALLLAGLGLLVLFAPSASAALEQQREATFPMANGFDDRLIVISGELALDASAVSGSAAFMRTSGAEISGLTRVCWQAPSDLFSQCANGPLKLVVPNGASFGFTSPAGYPAGITANHALVTFVDLARSDGFDARLRVGPSAVMSLVDGQVKVGDVPTLTERAPGAFTVLERTGTLELRTDSGVLVHTIKADDPPIVIEGAPIFPPAFSASVVVLPFEDGASANFVPADDSAAAIGLSNDRLDLLDEVLRNARLIEAGAKVSPFAILAKAGVIVSEVFNGAFIRTSLADDPNGLGDVGFAKFEELTVTDGVGRNLGFDGSYTLVVGDLGPSFQGSEVSNQSQPLRWWVGVFLLLAVVVVGAWLWLRDGPVQRTEPGPHTMVARIATAVGVLGTFLVWDWQVNEVLGSSLLTTGASGTPLGMLMLVEVGSLLLATLLIGLPVFLIVRYGLALAKKPRFESLAVTSAVFFTVAFGVLLLPAMVSFLVGLPS